MSHLDGIFDERVCPVCGKHFFKAPAHVYKVKRDKYNTVYMCSWTCFNRFKRMNKSK